MLQSMGLPRVGHDRVTELTELNPKLPHIKCPENALYHKIVPFYQDKPMPWQAGIGSSSP